MLDVLRLSILFSTLIINIFSDTYTIFDLDKFTYVYRFIN